jgi:hypothetical protein
MNRRTGSEHVQRTPAGIFEGREGVPRTQHGVGATAPVWIRTFATAAMLAAIAAVVVLSAVAGAVRDRAVITLVQPHESPATAAGPARSLRC